MPLPSHPLTVHGGCGCGAIRYKVDIPALADRPLHPLSDASAKWGEVPLPFIAIDHCNEFRRATRANLPLWLCAPTKFISGSALPRSSEQQPEQQSHAAGKETWIPGLDLFQPGPASKDTFLTFHRSSKEVTRSFCGRCGTHLMYRHDRIAAMGFPEMLDIMLGTVDRKDLDTKDLAPERHLWVGCGIEWITEFASKGSGGLPMHPEFSIKDVVD